MATLKLKRRGSKLLLAGVEYTGFPVGELPKRFGFINDEEKDTNGICSWFNHKGWTFIRKSDL